MKNNDDIPTTDTNEIKQLINRVKLGELDQGDALLIEKLQTSRTGLRRVPWVDIYAPYSLPGRLVADHPLQLGKTPGVYTFRLAGLTNPIEIFHDDPLIVCFRVSHDLSAIEIADRR